MTPLIFHIREGQQRWWFITDGKHNLSGMVGKSLRPLIAEWLRLYGHPTGGFTQFQGLHTRAEAAITIADRMGAP